MPNVKTADGCQAENDDSQNDQPNRRAEWLFGLLLIGRVFGFIRVAVFRILRLFVGHLDEESNLV
jgi:hypothetical protein